MLFNSLYKKCTNCDGDGIILKCTDCDETTEICKCEIPNLEPHDCKCCEGTGRELKHTDTKSDY